MISGLPPCKPQCKFQVLPDLSTFSESSRKDIHVLREFALFLKVSYHDTSVNGRHTQMLVNSLIEAIRLIGFEFELYEGAPKVFTEKYDHREIMGQRQRIHRLVEKVQSLSVYLCTVSRDGELQNDDSIIKAVNDIYQEILPIYQIAEKRVNDYKSRIQIKGPEKVYHNERKACRSQSSVSVDRRTSQDKRWELGPVWQRANSQGFRFTPEFSKNSLRFMKKEPSFEESMNEIGDTIYQREYIHPNNQRIRSFSHNTPNRAYNYKTSYNIITGK